MTNPDEIVRVRARNGGRASVYEANAWCQNLGAGLLSGTGVVASDPAGLSVTVGPSSSELPDVVIAKTHLGYSVALDIIGNAVVTVTPPLTRYRYTAIVAYTNDISLESEDDTTTGSPSSCGLIPVNGTEADTVIALQSPTDEQIRTAITEDGGTGATAAYAIIALVRLAGNTTSITSGLITTVSSRRFDRAIKNIVPAVDKPTEWVKALGAPGEPGQGGYWVEYINEAELFGDQPSQYGWLETICEGVGNVYQRWTTHPDGPVRYRCGNATGWWGANRTGGAFRTIAHQIPYAVSDAYSFNSGFTCTSGQVTKIGDVVIANLVVQASTAFANADTQILTFKSGFAPATGGNINSAAYFATSEWTTNAIGYMFTGTTGLIVKNVNNLANANFVKLNLVYRAR